MRISKRRSAGWGAEIPSANNGLPKEEVVKIFLPSVTNRHRLVVRLDETAIVGLGTEKLRKLEMRAANCLNCGFRNGGRRGGGAEIPPVNKGSQKEEFAKISLPLVTN